MNLVTKFKIATSVNEVYEAFVDPEKIGNFWFSSSSERWESGKKIQLTYDEYNARLEITVVEAEPNKKIAFKWGADDEERTITITLHELENSETIIEVNEEGFADNDPDLMAKLLDNKEGWVFMLTCLKGYLEFGVTKLRGGLVKD
ncbi:SRPBCC family protein [Peribacillus sp. SCS-155]|uniref:SRPBCC family protein n=1 Tax=Peribacillus sedimenti TaxID=3115297 RepID=UPI0039067513